MKISSAQQNLSSSHLSLEHREVSERLRMWVGEPPRENTTRPNATRSNDNGSSAVNISPTAQALARAAEALSPPSKNSIENTATTALAAAMDNVDNDPALAMLRSMLERVFGIRVKTFDAADLETDHAFSEDLQKIERNATWALPHRFRTA